MSLPCGTFNTRYEQVFAVLRTRTHWAMIAALFMVLAILPLILSSHILTVINIMLIVMIAVLGLNIVTGYCGQINFGQAAFMAVGAYSSGLLMNHFGLSFWLCLPAAGIMATLVGILFGMPSVRVKGLYLALVTLAAQFIIIYVIETPLQSLTGGQWALRTPAPKLWGITFNTQLKLFYLIAGITALMTFFAKNLTRTRVGRNFVAVRDNDIAAEVMGINIFRTKVLAFAICSFYAGVAGSLWAHYQRAFTTTDFSFMQSIWFVGMMIVGGMGTTLGPILGTLFITLLDQLVLRFTPAMISVLPVLTAAQISSIAMFAFALVIIVFLVWEPRGLAHRWQIFKTSYRLWPFAY
ncbi:MAG: branched-chain amino acid ABC transporter permease [Chloroflexi bacterium]|nr:branched-chain amino acid ABC transporter permease [Chloroflexota bacterium]